MTDTQRTIIRDGKHTNDVVRVLGAKGIPAASLVILVEKAAQILAKSVDPIAGPPEQPSDGLLYGLIQSGKTSVIQVATAMAADNGFQCIVILTSDIDLLYEQTLGRMKSALQGLQVIGKNDWKDAARFQRSIRNTPLVIVCSKNGSKLGGLIDAFRTAGARGLSTLLVDDEADQASLNTYTSKETEQVSRINEVISDFRDFFPVNTYLQVTATPQALFLQDPNHRYRPSFTILSEPGPGYVGGKEFFGDPDRRLLETVEIEEVNELLASNQPSPTSRVPRRLREALLTFLVGATARLIEDGSKGYAFLCHVSLNKKHHDHIVSIIERFRDDTKDLLDSAGTKQYEQLIQDLKSAYDDLAETQVGLPPFEDVVEKIRFYLPGANVKLINATSSEEVSLDAVYNIFVGGNKLGRGVTIENLLVSYYGRNPKKPNADTVLQHARMYGYRFKDIGVTRLFLPERLEENFGLIHEMESALRDLVEKYPEGKFEILYISSPLQATRRNVLDPNSLVAYVAGKSINPSHLLRSADAAASTASIDDELKHIGDNDSYQEITVDEVIALLERCPVDPANPGTLWDMKNIRTALITLKKLMGNQAYLVVRRGRDLAPGREETAGILSGGEIGLAPTEAPTLFLYRQKNTHGTEVWWPQLRFPEGDRNYVLSFSINTEDIGDDGDDDESQDSM